jgi:UDP:flavonoid glycosyltransferase YjiC (YdhE family)
MQIEVITIGSRGDVQPYVALGKGLRNAGHSVRIVTHAPFEALVRGEGLDFASSGGDPRALVESHFKWQQPSCDREDSAAANRPSWLPRGVIDARDALRSGRGMMDGIMQAMLEMTE